MQLHGIDWVFEQPGEDRLQAGRVHGQKLLPIQTWLKDYEARQFLCFEIVVKGQGGAEELVIQHAPGIVGEIGRWDDFLGCQEVLCLLAVGISRG